MRRHSFKYAVVSDFKNANMIDALLDKLERVAIHQHMRNNYLLLLYIMTNRELPDPARDPLWSALLKKNERLLVRTVVFAGADTLRWNNVHISKQISWEQSAQDFLAQWYTNKALEGLQGLGHFILRFGVTGMIYTYALGARLVHRLLFDPSAHEVGIFRDVSRDGDIVGHQTATTTNVILSIMEGTHRQRKDKNDPSRFDQSTIADHVGVGLRKAIKHCQALFTIGLRVGVSGSRKGGLSVDATPFDAAALRLAFSPAPGHKHPSPIGEERNPCGMPGLEHTYASGSLRFDTHCPEYRS